jgi:hypothetical protein
MLIEGVNMLLIQLVSYLDILEFFFLFLLFVSVVITCYEIMLTYKRRDGVIKQMEKKLRKENGAGVQQGCRRFGQPVLRTGFKCNHAQRVNSGILLCHLNLDGLGGMEKVQIRFIPMQP